MFFVTIVSSSFAIALTLLVLAAIQTNKDKSESTGWLKKAMMINMAGLLVLTITSVCASHFAGFFGNTSNESYRICCVLRELANIFFIPMCAMVSEYIRTICHNKTEISAVVDKVRRIHIGTSILSTLVIVAFCLLRSLNIISASAALVLYIAEVVLANVAIADIIVVIYIARKELRKTRIVCFVLYFIFVLISLAALWITDENIFFVINTCLLVFLLMALQTDDLNRSSEDRKKAQSQAADLNTQLKFSKEKLQIETFLLEEISGVYDSLHLIDLKNNTYRQLGAPPPKAEAIITGELADAGNQALIWAIMQRVTSPLYTDGAIAFTDFSTLNERMKGKKVITYEAIDDENQWFRFSFIRVGNDLDTNLETVIYTSMNIDEEKRETERLRQVSYADELTGVYNRNYYITHCDAFRDAGAPDSIWMIVVDINGLKAVNDDIGHEAGDELIIATAECLKEAFGDGGSVFRIGGDEFVVSVHATDSEFAEMLEKLENLRAAWKGKFTESLHFSVGSCKAGEMPGITYAELVKEADRRMYKEKRAFYSYNPTMDRRGHIRTGAESE